MGAVHAAVLLMGFVLLLLLLVVLTAVHYVPHLNSFYTDTAAWLGLVFTLATGLRLVIEEHEQSGWVVQFYASACFLIGSKPAHSFLALFLFPLRWPRCGVAGVIGPPVCPPWVSSQPLR